MNDALLDAVPHFVVRSGAVVSFSSSLADELACDPRPLLGALDEVGTRLDDVGFDELVSGESAVRVRLSSELDDRPVRLRRLGADTDRVWIEVRSLGAEFRAEALLRRSGYGHMLISPESWVHWSLSSDELHEAMPGDDPIKWVELMDPDDMQAITLAVHDVAHDPDLRRTVTHRLAGDDGHIVVDTIESVMYDPDLRAVLMRSRLERTDDTGADADRSTAAPWTGISVSDHLPIGVLVASRAGRTLHRNAVAAELIGVRSGQMLVPDGDGPWALATLEPEASAPFVRMIRDAAEGRSGYCMVPSPFDPDRWLRMSVSPATATTLVLTIEDTTELADAERALRASNRLLEALDSHAEDLVMVFGSDGGGRYISSSVRKHLGGAIEVAHADDFYPFVHPPDRQIVDELIRRVQERPASSEQIEFRVDVGGEVGRWHQATMTNLLDDPDVRGFVVTLRDVHERHLAERDLQFRATHDSLTTLPDRAALQSRLEALLAESKAGGKRIALMFCDIDHFKSINDRAGHHVGDLVLTEVAARLRSALRSSDVVGRFGGDEFVVVVPDVEDEAYALAVAERIFDTVTGPGLFEGTEVDVRVSMGVAVTGDDCATAATLLQRADLAMYEAKAQGRGRVSLFVPSGEGGSERDTLRADLHDAIADRQLAVHYQPIVPLRDGLETGMEAFARWEHPALGMIEAKRFIGIAEGAGPDVGPRPRDGRARRAVVERSGRRFVRVPQPVAIAGVVARCSRSVAGAVRVRRGAARAGRRRDHRGGVRAGVERPRQSGGVARGRGSRPPRRLRRRLLVARSPAPLPGRRSEDRRNPGPSARGRAARPPDRRAR